MIGGASDPPMLVSQESPQASKRSPVPSQDVRRGLSPAWAAVEGQLVGERRRVVAVVAVLLLWWLVLGLWRGQLNGRPAGRSGLFLFPFLGMLSLLQVE